MNAALSATEFGVALFGSIIVFMILFLLLVWEMNKRKGIVFKEAEYEEKAPRIFLYMIISGIIIYLIIQLLIGILLGLIFTIYLMASLYTNFLKSLQEETLK